MPDPIDVFIKPSTGTIGFHSSPGAITMSGAGRTDQIKFIGTSNGDLVIIQDSSVSVLLPGTNGLDLGSNAQRWETWVTDIHVSTRMYDKNEVVGTPGWVLSTTGTGISWTSPLSLVGVVTGSGTIGVVPKFTGSTILGNSQITDNVIISISTSTTITGQLQLPNIGSGVGAGLSIGGDTNLYRLSQAVLASDAGLVVSGSVGVGTTMPTQKLHIQGNTRITGALYDSNNAVAASGWILSTTGTGISWTAPSGGGVSGTGIANSLTKWSSSSVLSTAQITDDVTISISTSTAITGQLTMPTSGVLGGIKFTGFNHIKSTGNDLHLQSNRTTITNSVGIGSTPNYLLQITNTVAGELVIIEMTSALEDLGAVPETCDIYRKFVQATSSQLGQFDSIDFAANVYNLGVTTNQSNPVYHKTISIPFSGSTFGYVGINQPVPTQQLHVQGNVRITGFIYDSNNNIGSLGNVLARTGTGISWTSPVSLVGVMTGSGTIGVVPKFTGSTILGNSQITDNVIISISTSTTITGQLQIPNTGSGPGAGVSIGGDTNLYRLSQALLSTDAGFVIKGSVGIGTTMPTQVLHVQGNTRITGALYDSNNAVAASGWILSTTGTGISWTAPSGGSISGTGIANSLTKWSGAGTITTAQITDNITISISTSVTIAGNLSINNRLYDYTNGAGSTGFILKSLHTGIAWTGDLKTIGLRSQSQFALTTGNKKIYLPVGFAGSIISWQLVADTATTTTLDIWKANNALPTNSNSITGGAKPSLSNATVNNSSALTGWDTFIYPNDILELEIESNDNATCISLVLNILKST